MAEAPAFLALAWQTTVNEASPAASTLDPSITNTTLLKAIATTSVTVPHVYLVATATGGQLNHWLLRAGTDAEDAPAGILRPDDYAASTNEKIFQLWS